MINTLKRHWVLALLLLVVIFETIQIQKVLMDQVSEEIEKNCIQSAIEICSDICKR